MQGRGATAVSLVQSLSHLLSPSPERPLGVVAGVAPSQWSAWPCRRPVSCIPFRLLSRCICTA